MARSDKRSAMLLSRAIAGRIPRPLLILFYLLFGSNVFSQPIEEAEEYPVKAAAIYNIAMFTQWPNSNANIQTPLQFCVFGDNPFGASLDFLADNSPEDRPLEISYFSSPQNITSDCSLLFISRSEQNRLDLILNTSENRPILTISDIENFAGHGGMVGIDIVNENLKLLINLEVARRAGLTLSSNLLELATIVSSQP